jgi:hypothetical protein
VVDDGDGCRVVFTLHRRPGMTDDEFAADAAAVRADLGRLRDVVEGLSAPGRSGGPAPR